MTFEQQVQRYTPQPGLAIVEPWHSGGTIKGGLVASHSRDLPCVYSFIHRLPRGYDGVISEGMLVLHPRYAYETFARGVETGVDGTPTPWELAAMNLDDIEAIIPLDMIVLQSEDECSTKGGQG
jgi:hypothetical protein